MTRSRHLTIALLLTITSAACETAPVLAPETAAFAGTDPVAAVLASVSSADPGLAPSGDNSLFDRLAGEISGFGGLYRAGNCSVAVVLTDMSQAEHAIRVVTTAIESLIGRACAEGLRVHAVQGKFTYAELQRYLGASRDLLQIRGVGGAHVDYKLNRLVITVESREVAKAVGAALPGLGIPAEAVAFDVRGSAPTPGTPTPGPVRPVPGTPQPAPVPSPTRG